VVEDLTTVKNDFAAHKVTNAIQKWNSTSNELPSDLPQAIGGELSGDRRHCSKLAELPGDGRYKFGNL
jgi:hypothetical protein